MFSKLPISLCILFYFRLYTCQLRPQNGLEFLQEIIGVFSRDAHFKLDKAFREKGTDELLHVEISDLLKGNGPAAGRRKLASNVAVSVPTCGVSSTQVPAILGTPPFSFQISATPQKVCFYLDVSSTTASSSSVGGKIGINIDPFSGKLKATYYTIPMPTATASFSGSYNCTKCQVNFGENIQFYFACSINPSSCEMAFGLKGGISYDLTVTMSQPYFGTSITSPTLIPVMSFPTYAIFQSARGFVISVQPDFTIGLGGSLQANGIISINSKLFTSSGLMFGYLNGGWIEGFDASFQFPAPTVTYVGACKRHKI